MSIDSAAHPDLGVFAGSLPLTLDDFQLRACRALEDGHGVLVCAPTGAGKTIVGEFAVHLALVTGTKCFYTTPIKALSNQKYHDLAAVHGDASVGLLTGDSSINADAPVVVMTTEVLRNMLYANSPALLGLSYVVMDEVHFLADRFRGAVWEEVILNLDPDVRVASLSATVSNSREFGDWIQAVRGDTTVVVDEHRPVPLQQHMLVGNRLFDLLDPRGTRTSEVNPELKRFIRHRTLVGDDDRGRGGPHGRKRRDGRPARPPRSAGVSRPRLVTRLDSEGLLPAIDFIFSRLGCDAALDQCLRSGISLLTPAQAKEVDEVADRHLRDVAPGDAEILGVDAWRTALRRGLAAHHAGLLPTFRHAVEELFVRGLVRVVFATETLALGINMPARSVVLERLVKFNGESHVDLTPGEYTQLTGRAGRRGIDVEGHALVVWNPQVSAESVAGLATGRTFPLRSSFRPEYNMAVNLIDRLRPDGSRDLLNRSFAQFQADRSVVGQARKLDEMTMRLAKLDVELAGAAAARGIDPGTPREAGTGAETDDADVNGADVDGADVDGADVDGATGAGNTDDGFLGYVSLREQIRQRERDVRFASRMSMEDALAADLTALKRGHVIGVPTGRHRGIAVVLESASVPADPKPLVLTGDAWCGRVGVRDFVNPPQVLGNMRLNKHVDRRTGRGRRDLASALRATGIEMPPGRGKKRPQQGADAELTRLRSRLRAHPAHRLDNSDDLFRLAERRNRLVRDIVAAERSIETRTSTLAMTFDRIVGALTDLGYLSGTGNSVKVTDAGKLLQRIYSESDLVVTECLRAGVWDGLNGPDLAAVVASMVFEARRESYSGMDSMPADVSLRTALIDTHEVWRRVTDVEGARRISPSREPDTGFSVAVRLWASGGSLAASLAAAGEHGHLLSPGDFVRWNRQVIDLLEQIRLGVGAGTDLGRSARTAVNGIRRGVVAVEMS